MLRLLIPAFALLASGCVNLLPEAPPPPRVYTMHAASIQPVTTQPLPVVIAVATPQASRALAVTDIAWVKDGQLAYAEGASWAGRSVDLLQMVLIHTIDQRGAVRGAVRTGEARADIEVRTEIIDFQVDEDDGLNAKLSARIKLFDGRTRALMDSTSVEERVPLADRSASAAARAMEQAAQNAAVKIAAWAEARAPLPAAKP